MKCKPMKPFNSFSTKITVSHIEIPKPKIYEKIDIRSER